MQILSFCEYVLIPTCLCSERLSSLNKWQYQHGNIQATRSRNSDFYFILVYRYLKIFLSSDWGRWNTVYSGSPFSSDRYNWKWELCFYKVRCEAALCLAKVSNSRTFSFAALSIVLSLCYWHWPLALLRKALGVCPLEVLKTTAGIAQSWSKLWVTRLLPSLLYFISQCKDQ